MKIASLTQSNNYFEDFQPGDLIRHARGKTIESLDNVMFSNLVMNTSQGHFNEHFSAAMPPPFGQRLVFGGLTFALVVGLASQDTSENALAEVSVERISFKSPVKHGDTIYAYSEVLSVSDAPDRSDGGLVRFRHWGVNERDQVVCEAERTVLIKRRAHWGDR